MKVVLSSVYPGKISADSNFSAAEVAASTPAIIQKQNIIVPDP